jgi:hypothetical protein
LKRLWQGIVTLIAIAQIWLCPAANELLEPIGEKTAFSPLAQLDVGQKIF